MIKFIGIAFILAQFCFQGELTTIEEIKVSQMELNQACLLSENIDWDKGEIDFWNFHPKRPQVLIRNWKYLDEEKMVVLKTIRQKDNMRYTALIETQVSRRGKHRLQVNFKEALTTYTT